MINKRQTISGPIHTTSLTVRTRDFLLFNSKIIISCIQLARWENDMSIGGRTNLSLSLWYGEGYRVWLDVMKIQVNVQENVGLIRFVVRGLWCKILLAFQWLLGCTSVFRVRNQFAPLVSRSPNLIIIRVNCEGKSSWGNLQNWEFQKVLDGVSCLPTFCQLP